MCVVWWWWARCLGTGLCSCGRGGLTLCSLTGHSPSPPAPCAHADHYNYKIGASAKEIACQCGAPNCGGRLI